MIDQIAYDEVTDRFGILRFAISTVAAGRWARTYHVGLFTPAAYPSPNLQLGRMYSLGSRDRALGLHAQLCRIVRAWPVT